MIGLKYGPNTEKITKYLEQLKNLTPKQAINYYQSNTDMKTPSIDYLDAISSATTAFNSDASHQQFINIISKEIRHILRYKHFVYNVIRNDGFRTRLSNAAISLLLEYSVNDKFTKIHFDIITEPISHLQRYTAPDTDEYS